MEKAICLGSSKQIRTLSLKRAQQVHHLRREIHIARSYKHFQIIISIGMLEDINEGIVVSREIHSLFLESGVNHHIRIRRLAGRIVASLTKKVQNLLAKLLVRILAGH